MLVNNAGVLQDALLGMITETMMRSVIDTNLIGALVHLQEASRLMARNKAGSIVNVSSIIGRFGNEGQAVYAASKAGVIGMTLAAAKEMAPKNVRVNAIAPGFIDTDMTRALPPEKISAACGRHPYGPRGGRRRKSPGLSYFWPATWPRM